jgi:flagellar protein FlbT
MAGLVLKLKAGERVIINGAVLESVDRPSRMRVLTPGTDILRLRDAINPEDARTPVGRLTHLLQMLVAGLVPTEAALQEAQERITDLQAAFSDPEDLSVLGDVADELDAGRLYPALRRMQSLLPKEKALLARHRAVS